MGKCKVLGRDDVAGKSNFPRKRLSACLLGMAMSTLPYAAHAVGIGDAETKTFIGEPLQVKIPLLNVKQPDALIVSLDADYRNESGEPSLSAEIRRFNSELGILVSSDMAFNEPFITFDLNLNDGGDKFNKNFTVLLDLAPASQKGAYPEGSAPRVVSNQIQSEPLSSEPVTGSVMGPYDWAQPGQVPEKFGAVLDGQSLWRVARRINKAMGVSIEQMMWALYQENPEAFSGSGVETLKSGTYLTIPSASTVRSVTQMEAVRLLDGIQRPTTRAEVAVQASPQQDSAPVETSEESIDARTEVAASQDSEQFQVGGIEEFAGGNAQTNEIINSLTQSVGNLTQQLALKDKKIEFLESQVSDLQKQLSSSGLATEEEAVSETFMSDDALSIPVAEETVASSVIAQAEPQPAEYQEEPAPAVVEATSAVASSMAEQAVDGERKAWWQWALLAFGVVGGLGFFARKRLARTARNLNLFGAREPELPKTVLVDLERQAEQEEAAPKKTDFSDLKKIDERVAFEFDDDIDGFSYLDLGSSLKVEEDVDLVDVAELSELSVDEDLTFEERFNALLKDKDFAFARELLDFARYNEIEDERYHCERLRLLRAMEDQDAFYKYYYEIESKIPSFPPALQTRISEFVVEIASD